MRATPIDSPLTIDRRRPHRLVTYHELPKWCQDNPFIVRGYRTCEHKKREIIKSIFVTYHNETFNVWSHLMAAGKYAVVAYSTNITHTTTYC